jgi:hypothetical protein
MASLAEVYGQDFLKPRHKKKKRKKVQPPGSQQNVPLSPMDPQEMDKELLSDVFDDSLRPDEKVRGLKTSVYSQDKNIYQPIQNPNVMTYENQFDVYEDQPRRLAETTEKGWRGEDAEGLKRGLIDLIGDPDFEAYFEMKKAARAKANQGPPKGVGTEGFQDPVSQSEQFNELLLYIFTGFFIMMLFDNIYKLGRDSY